MGTGFSDKIMPRKKERLTMLEMPPLQFAQTNGIRMGYYEAGPKSDTRRSFSATAGRRSRFHGPPDQGAGCRRNRVIAPDQRGYGATAGRSPSSHDMEHLTGDLVGLLDHLKIDKEIFVGHDWGGLSSGNAAAAHRPRSPAWSEQHAAHQPRAGGPIELFRQTLRRAHVHRAISGSLA